MVSLAALTVRTVPAALTCGVTMANDGRVITVGPADQLAAQLDEQQYDMDEGPCLQALRESHIVDAPDLSVEQRWDGYPPAAMGLGVAAIYSSPLIVAEHTIGVVNLYADRKDPFTQTTKDLIAQLVSLTAVAVTATLRNYADVSLTDQLQEALNSRSVIDQAIGIIIATQKIGPTAAFGMLRKQSQNSNTRVAVIAQRLVDQYVQP